MENVTGWTNDIGNSEFKWNEFVNSFYHEDWGKLTVNEKGLCMNYERQLVNDIHIGPEMVLAINEIHEKYPEFHMGCLPRKKETVNPLEFRTMDFSNFLQDEPV